MKKDTNNSSRSAAIDLLRVLAVAGVIIAHWTWDPIWVTKFIGRHPTEVFSDFSQIGRYGFLGVHIFFMISGAVIVHTAIGRSPRNFVIARFTRLFPALLLSVLITIFILWKTAPSKISVLIQAFTSTFMLTPKGSDTWINPVLWTLQVEIFFYSLVCLVCLFAGPTKSNLWKFAWVWFGVTVLTWINGDLVWLHTISMADYAPFFIIGMLISLSTSSQERIISIPAILVSIYLGSQTIFGGMDPFGRSQTIITSIIFLGVIFLCFSIWASWISSWNSQIISKLGLMTYSLYLFHEYPGKFILEKLLEGGAGQSSAYFASALAVLALSWAVTQWFEPPVRKYLNSLMVNSKSVRN